MMRRKLYNFFRRLFGRPPLRRLRVEWCIGPAQDFAKIFGPNHANEVAEEMGRMLDEERSVA